MGLLIKIAFRNLLRHKGRSLVIGAILFAGALVMSLGNGIISGMEKGLEANIIHQWTGHLIIMSSRQTNDDALFSPKPMKVIRHYPQVETALRNDRNVRAFLPATKGLVMVLNIGARKRAAEHPVLSMLLGVDFQHYRKMFNNSVSLLEGSGLGPDEKGLLVNVYERKKIYESENTWLLPLGTGLNRSKMPPDALSEIDTLETASSLVLMGIGDDNSALDVFAHVKGIYEFKALNLLFKEINLIDLESFRECFDYVTRAESQTAVSKENSEILDATEESLMHYFSKTALIEGPGLETDLGTDALKKEVDTGGMITATAHDAYNLIFVKLHHGQILEATLHNLNNRFQSNGTDARAVSWRKAIGYISDISLLFRIALNIFVFFIFFVAVIIIINTLTLNTLERTPEIGTMRAIGAPKRFITRMLILETLFLACLFGSLGLISGSLLTLFLSGLDLAASNEMMSLAFGGDTFCPVMDLNGMTHVFIQLTVVTLMAVLYPVHLAKKVSPLDAVARD
ncbi:FtsX-like permease family protein [Desulfoluna sp.]|uniref:ABC transporter permease n=1 Tax=Desulfoluna sp. TaxID=2045199 RepID=UPI0026108F3A|nr:FtsX-like permease family protein [Desulfoluna sp.]